MQRDGQEAETTAMPGNGGSTPLYEHGVSKQVSPQPVMPQPSARSMLRTHRLVAPNFAWRAFARAALPHKCQEQDSIAPCSEAIQQLRDRPGINGVHIIASGWDDFIPEVLTRAGIGNRAERATVAGALSANTIGGHNSAV